MMDQVRGIGVESGGRPIDTSRWRLQVMEVRSQDGFGVMSVFEADSVAEITAFLEENEDIYPEFWVVAPSDQVVESAAAEVGPTQLVSEQLRAKRAGK